MSAPACLRTLADLVEGRGDVPFRLMCAGKPWGRAGGGPVRLVCAYGVQGRGETWAEAAAQWAAGARDLADNPPQPEPMQLSLWGAA